jgi:hypothetical protein
MLAGVLCPTCRHCTSGPIREQAEFGRHTPLEERRWCLTRKTGMEIMAKQKLESDAWLHTRHTGMHADIQSFWLAKAETTGCP